MKESLTEFRGEHFVEPSGVRPRHKHENTGATIREWLAECQTHHADYRKTISPETSLATRILAVQECKPNHFSIKLVMTENVDHHSEPYIVLSHVWGGIDVRCKTTNQNFTRYLDIGIEFNNLPATFQDAVRITAAIGFRYLWIYYLCIIPVNKRAWMFHERLLSRRVLHDTHSQFVWHCGNIMETEDGIVFQDKRLPSETDG